MTDEVQPPSAGWFAAQLTLIGTKLEEMRGEMHNLTRGVEQRLVRLEERDTHKDGALGRAFQELKELRDKVVALEVSQQVPNRVSAWVILGGGLVFGAILTALVAMVIK